MKIMQLFVEKNKLQPKTCSRQAHEIFFLRYWRHKYNMMAIGFGCTDGCWSPWVQEVVSDPITMKRVQNRVLFAFGLYV